MTTVTGFCNEKTNTTAEVKSTNFVGLEVQSKKESGQTKIFAQNNCRATNRRFVGPILAQCSTTGQPDRQHFNAIVQLDFSLNRTTDGVVVTVTSSGNTLLVNISLDSK